MNLIRPFKADNRKKTPKMLSKSTKNPLKLKIFPENVKKANLNCCLYITELH